MLGLLICSSSVFAQRATGELRLQVFDPSGAPLESTGTLTGQATGVARTFTTDPAGNYTIRALPFGQYLLMVQSPGFVLQSAVIEIQSEIPLGYAVTLQVLPVETTVDVREESTLLDASAVAATQYLSPQSLEDHPSAQPGRSIVTLVNTRPGWLLEANGVLHPRGSEYDVQYVIDGIPLYDNRSPAFAQSLGIEEFQSLNVRTAGFPAEFGLKLGGVIELTTERDSRPGLHGTAVIQGGSFGERSAFVSLRETIGRTAVGGSLEGMMTDRYLDPPVEQNYTNHASGGGSSLSLEHDWSDSDRTRFYAQRRRTGFLVPNELIQQAAGQRQDRSAAETSGQISHTHIFTPSMLSQFRMMVRSTTSDLWANVFSTPIVPFQDRGFREMYWGGTLSAHHGQHEFKAGAEGLFSSIHEDLSFHIITYNVGSVRIFDPGVPEDFRFSGSHKATTQSVFAQDSWRLGNVSINAGLRFDRRRLIERESAWSPRLGLAYSIPSAGVVVHAAYDRVFQIPATENVLLASSNLLPRLGGEGAFVPLLSSRGNFLETGLSKSVSSRLRLDGSWFRRRLNNFADDSLLLNTGVSFPTAFSEAVIHGYEASIEVPAWGRFSGYATYSNMVGTGYLPIAGGLFLGDDAAELLHSKDSFPISQDQRNTFRSQFRVKPHRLLWFAVGGSYNSGLPFESEDIDFAFAAEQYGSGILQRVNFNRGRMRPSFTVDCSVGVQIHDSERAKVRIQFDAFNLTNHLNLINFAGVFSGTALDAPRHFAMRMRAEF